MKIIARIPMWLKVSLITAIVGAILMTPFVRSGSVVFVAHGKVWLVARIIYRPLTSIITKIVASLPPQYPHAAFQRMVGFLVFVYNFTLFFIIGAYFYWFFRLYLKIKFKLLGWDKETNLENL